MKSPCSENGISFLGRSFLLACLTLASALGASLGLAENLLLKEATTGAFPLVATRSAAPIFVDHADYPGVQRAARDLCADVERVSGLRPTLSSTHTPHGDSVVIIGTLGHSPLIDQLAKAGKIKTADLEGKWESFSISTITDPLPGVSRALVIAGSDKRGTIYGIYEISEQIGVSPWYWWADVPTQHRDMLYLKAGYFLQGPPVVKYRGIFLNDEAPCLTGWTKEKFGGFNSQFYTKVFELLLRLRGNYLWPAMWDNAFNEDDPENPRLADEYGIVMGTSHHEPMMRAHKEWTSRHQKYGNGKWNYASNAEALQQFFREGIARNGKYENLVTVGMRGDGDEGMVSTGSMDSDISLLKRVIDDQRRILSEELKAPASQTPQLWALFTEVQKFYEHGLRPPDDVTLLWTDDNTGNLRRLPTAEERKRSGGSGIYYHFDMHGGPYAYQWINTNPLPKIAEQMNLAYEYGATRIWIVNVGDLKPLEIPLEFFLRLAWNPAALTKDKIADYGLRWAEREFGPEHAAEIADLMARYTKYNGWRKPELIKPDTFSSIHFGEAERVEALWSELEKRADKLNAVLRPEQRDAFFQLVLHPLKASAVVAKINISAGRNHLYAMQGRASTNAMAEEVRALFRQDRALSDQYNRDLAGGKWNHLMDQPHLGQFSWEPPVADVMPAVSELLPSDNSDFGVSIEGDVNTWPAHFGGAVLPDFESFQPSRSYVDIFALGTQAIDFTISAEQPWILLSAEPHPKHDHRYWVEIDWSKAPEGKSTGTIKIQGKHRTIQVKVPIHKASLAQAQLAKGRLASLSGPLAFPATATTKRSEVHGVRWEEVPDYGRGAAALAIYPVTAASILPPSPSPQLEYSLYLPRAGSYELTLVLGPVMDFVPERGMRIAVAFDDETPQVLDIFTNREDETFLGKSWWSQFTRDNARFLKSSHQLKAEGPHNLKITMVDPGVVVQKIIISDRPIPTSYFGPTDSTPVP